MHRYRDTCDEIRMTCALNLGRAVCELPSFLGDHQLKYLGWMLNDTSPLVRNAALSSLHSIYRAHHTQTAKLANFTVRFEKRIYEMMRDVDRTVRRLPRPPMASYGLL